MTITKSSRPGIAGVLLAASALATPAFAGTIDGTILADNGSIAVMQTSGNYQVLSQSVSGNWPKHKSFSFDVSDDPRFLAVCKIHVIAWGDGAVAQGVMAHFAGNAGANFTGKPGSSLNDVSMSSVTHPGGTAAGLSVAMNNAAAIIQGAGTPNTQFTSQPVVTGGIPGTWGPINLPANLDGRDQVAFVWNEPKAAINANPNNFRVISTPCSTVARAPEPVDPNTAVFECVKPGNGYLMDISTAPVGWSLKQPNGSPAPVNAANNVAWSAVQNAQWIGPGGTSAANGVWTYSRKVRIAECPNRNPVKLSVAYRADNIGTLRVKNAGGTVITSANQAGTPNYGFLPASLTNHSYAFPVGANGIYTIELEVRNTSGPTGASMSVQMSR